MEANAGLVAGSHIRNELVVIGPERIGAKPVEHLSDQVCQICCDQVGLTADGEIFVACNECAFPVCRPCYEYERQDGNQLCPQCKTRYKRLKGSPRVEGDEEEEDTDDLENEFNFGFLDTQNGHHIAEAMLHGQMNYGRCDHDMPHMTHTMLPQVPLLTNGPIVRSSTRIVSIPPTPVYQTEELQTVPSSACASPRFLVATAIIISLYHTQRQTPCLVIHSSISQHRLHAL